MAVAWAARRPASHFLREPMRQFVQRQSEAREHLTIKIPKPRPLRRVAFIGESPAAQRPSPSALCAWRQLHFAVCSFFQAWNPPATDSALR